MPWKSRLGKTVHDPCSPCFPAYGWTWRVIFLKNSSAAGSARRLTVLPCRVACRGWRPFCVSSARACIVISLFLWHLAQFRDRASRPACIITARRHVAPKPSAYRKGSVSNNPVAADGTIAIGDRAGRAVGQFADPLPPADGRCVRIGSPLCSWLSLWWRIPGSNCYLCAARFFRSPSRQRLTF